MNIYGISQSSGVERRLKIEKGVGSVVLTLTDTIGLHERGMDSSPRRASRCRDHGAIAGWIEDRGGFIKRDREE